MFTSVRTAIVITAALTATSCSGSGSSAGSNLPPWAAPAAAVARLVTYDSCQQTLDALIESTKDQVGPYGLGGDVRLYSDAVGLPVPAARDAAGSPEMVAGAADPAAVPGYSGTNVHEAGVDEPDLVKTDGRRLLTVTDGVLRVTDVATRHLIGELRLTSQGWPDQILLSGDRALLIARGSMYPLDDVAVDSSRLTPMTRMPVGTELTVVDVSGTPKVLSTIQLEGNYVDARQVGSVARVVLVSYPQLTFTQPDPAGSERKATAENRRILRDSELADWLPAYRQTTGGLARSGELVGCDAVHQVRGTPALSMLTVTSLDLAGDVQLSSADSVSVATGGETVYGTATSLYVAESPYGWAVPAAAAEDSAGSSIARPETQQTRIHKFDISAAGRPRYVASGSVNGLLLNQYSMSEYDQALRVATTLEPAGRCCVEGGRPTTHSAVTVLTQDGDRLVPIGAVDGLGKGERIYSVRFVGPVGYVVTFRQTDPLYTIDLSDPRQPRVVGELKINGYSAYLHPAGEGRLIGVGQDATAEGRTLGTQVSLFDVSNPAAPHRLASYQLSGGSSEAEFDPHAFLYWPADQTIVVPVQGPYPNQVAPDDEYIAAGQALVLRINGSEIEQVGMLTHRANRVDRSAPSDDILDATIRRAVVIGSSLWTVSAAGVLVSDLQTLDGQQWIPFPQVPKGGGKTPVPQPAPQPWPVPEPLPIDPPN